jgi:hypothetical protein
LYFFITEYIYYIDEYGENVTTPIWICYTEHLDINGNPPTLIVDDDNNTPFNPYYIALIVCTGLVICPLFIILVVLLYRKRKNYKGDYKLAG